MLSIAKSAYFHLAVRGKLKADAPSADPQRTGKAFAVGPNMLVTSQHNLGSPDDWEKKKDPSIPVEITRALQPLDREIVLNRNSAEPSISGLTNPTVLPTPAYTIDAAGLLLPNLNLKTYFQLSFCPIQTDGSYYAIMTSGDSKSASSVDNPVVAKLKAVGYKPEEFGGLYEFSAEEPILFAKDRNGHDGSPILAGDGSVVAIVSAVNLETGGRYRILATPVQPFFSVASSILSRTIDESSVSENANEPLKCSLSEAVDRIEKEVAAHAVWSLKVSREENGAPKDEIYFSYESISDKPNIDHIDVYFNFVGENRLEGGVRNRNELVTIPVPADANSKKYFTLTPTVDDDHRFATSKIVRLGREVIESQFAQEGFGGYIEYVELTIYPFLKNKRQLNKRVLQFNWTEVPK